MYMICVYAFAKAGRAAQRLAAESAPRIGWQYLSNALSVCVCCLSITT